MGFGLEIGFIDHFNTRLMTTTNYSAIADLHTLQITTAHAKTFQSAESSPVVPWYQRRFFSFHAHFVGSQLHQLNLLFTDSLTNLSQLTNV
jgi:hypothetical protein